MRNWKRVKTGEKERERTRNGYWLFIDFDKQPKYLLILIDQFYFLFIIK